MAEVWPEERVMRMRLPLGEGGGLAGLRWEGWVGLGVRSRRLALLLWGWRGWRWLIEELTGWGIFPDMRLRLRRSQ